MSHSQFVKTTALNTTMNEQPPKVGQLHNGVTVAAEKTNHCRTMQDTKMQNETKRAEVTIAAKLNPSEPVATMH